MESGSGLGCQALGWGKAMTGLGRERPILFQGAMVRAIQAGQKTQTRRIVKLPPLQPWQVNSKGWYFIESSHSTDDCDCYIAGFGDGLGTITNIKCPYGKPAFAPFDLPADRLWVREKYMKARCPIALSNAVQVTRGPAIDENWQHCAWYEDSHDPLGWPIREGWKSPIFMPRWASRITLEITAVRVERLQDISEADARAEGVCELSLQQGEPGAWWTADPQNPDIAGRTAVCAYRKLWEKIHGPGSWDVNPYVWVVEFCQVAPLNQPIATEP
jgi:hypothetical protein